VIRHEVKDRESGGRLLHREEGLWDSGVPQFTSPAGNKCSLAARSARWRPSYAHILRCAGDIEEKKRKGRARSSSLPGIWKRVVAHELTVPSGNPPSISSVSRIHWIKLHTYMPMKSAKLPDSNKLTI